MITCTIQFKPEGNYYLLPLSSSQDIINLLNSGIYKGDTLHSVMIDVFNVASTYNFKTQLWSLVKK